MPNYALCHYSFHRTWTEEGWDCLRLAEETRALGFPAIDSHARLLGDLDQAARDIPAALAATGLTLSGLSLGNNFAVADDDAWQQQIDTVIAGIRLAAQVGAPVSRIFGGHLPAADRADPALYERCQEQVLRGLETVVREAERAGIVLGLENHGGLPASVEEQIAVLDRIDSPHLKATADVGNYMQAGQEGHTALAAVVDRTVYVHFKDNRWGPPLQGCTLGDGAVDLAACLRVLAKAAYDGHIAIEYEGSEDERHGIRRSMEHLGKCAG